jgi:hypothetical protein
LMIHAPNNSVFVTQIRSVAGTNVAKPVSLNGGGS